jgi:hypothetical protein
VWRYHAELFLALVLEYSVSGIFRRELNDMPSNPMEGDDTTTQGI